MNRTGRQDLRSVKARTAAVALFLAGLGLPLAGYIGPGAGFAFLSSFLILFLTFFLALFSFLSWPFRFLARTIRGQRAYKKSLVNRVVVLGLDGLEPSLAEKFISEGKLPNLARLKKEGAYARLRTTTPAISPVAWSSFMTGAEPSKHNIFDFLSRDPRTYLPDLSSARIGKPRRVLSLGKYNIPLSKPEIRGMRKSVSFWKLLGEKGVFSTVLRVPITFPPEKFRGHLLSGMCAPDLKGSQGTFSFYTTDPGAAAKPEGGVAIPVIREANVIRTSISGPENSLLKTPEEIRLPMTITVNDKAETAVIDVSGERLELKKKTFSPWIRLTFRPGLGMKIRAICRFYVREVHPHFEMYVTPLNIDPEKPALPISHPFIYSVYLSKLLGSFITLGEANDTWALNEGVLDEAAFLELTYDNHLEWEGMLFNALKKTPKGLVAIVFETTDSIQHMFFRYLDKTHPALRAGKPALSGRVIEDLYIRMDDLVAKARGKQPGLIVVDRAVYGKNQNYLTPENRVPEKELPYPWESCIISGGGWSFTPNAKYMRGREGVQLLVDIVAKGGNLLLNVAPGPDGTWQQGAYDLLAQIGGWLKVNGEAIYSSRPIAPYREGKVRMTAQKDGSVYFVYLADLAEAAMPAEIRVASHRPSDGARVTLLGTTAKLEWKADGTNGFVVAIPPSSRAAPPCQYAWTIKVSKLR